MPVAVAATAARGRLADACPLPQASGADMALSTRFAALVLIASMFMLYTPDSKATTKTFVPERVFSGRSEGKGELQLLLGLCWVASRATD